MLKSLRRSSLSTASKMLAILLVLSTPLAQADLKDDVIARCRRQMGEYGAAMVKACVDQDLAAAKALAEYPQELRDIVARCQRQMENYGWSMVKACADQDIEAASALPKYPKKHESIIARCQRQMGEYGFSMVRTCVDQDIEAEESLKE